MFSLNTLRNVEHLVRPLPVSKTKKKKKKVIVTLLGWKRDWIGDSLD